MIQQLIWNQLYRTKVHAIYLELLLGKTETIDRSIKIFLAITSSASIAGWVIWKEHDFIWGMLIAASQAINAIRQYLPYKERLKSFSGLARELEEIAIYLELKWLEIAAGELSEKEMRRLYGDVLNKKSSAIQKYFPNNSIPTSDEKLELAENAALAYLSAFLTQGEKNEQQ